MFFGFSSTYFLFALPALLLGLLAQAWVQGAYNKWLRVRNGANLTGADAAQLLVRQTGLQLTVQGSKGVLSDHYDPRNNTLSLSQNVAQQPSVASLAIVAHELGHAEQDAQQFALLRLRSGMVPIANFGSWLGPILFLIGIFTGIYDLAWLGVICFAGATVFSLITLPVELDASRRGLSMLNQSGLLHSDEERKGARRVLTAAAFTYVAALVQSLSSLLYYGSVLGGTRRRRG